MIHTHKKKKKKIHGAVNIKLITYQALSVTIFMHINSGGHALPIRTPIKPLVTVFVRIDSGGHVLL